MERRSIAHQRAEVLAHVAEGEAHPRHTRRHNSAGPKPRGIRPCGRRTISTERAVPKASIRYCATSRRTSGSTISTTAPATTPRILPTPPIDDDQHDQDGLVEGEAFRTDVALEGGEDDPGHSPDCGTRGERGELHRRGVDADPASRVLVFPDGCPGLPENGAFDAEHQYSHDDAEPEQQKVEAARGDQRVSRRRVARRSS